MKNRYGFVSNSSSSSFIVLEPNLDTTARVALMMLSVVMEEYDAEGWLDDELEEEMEGAIDFLSNNTEYDKPICFPWGINYETFIRRTDEGIFVSTCNNHPWWDYFNCGSSNIEDDYVDDDTTSYLELKTLEQVGRKHYYQLWIGRQKNENT